MVTGAFRSLPGLFALGVGAVVAHQLSPLLGINELLLAIAIGVVITNTVGIPEILTNGIKTHNIWLAAGIVLLGASLTLDTILETGTTVLFLLVLVVSVTLVTVEVIARYFAGLSEQFSSLLAAGTSICGVSAVVAVGGAVRARETQIAYAAGVVLLMDAITLVVYPLLGNLFDLSGQVFGVWAGVSMLSTGPAVAVGFAHSETAGQWATMSKLARNALIGGIALAYASYYARRGTESSTSLRLLWSNFPKFVIGFLLLAVLASVGVFTDAQQTSISNAVNWLFLLAFVGLGTEIRIRNLRQIGFTPVFVVFAAMVIASALTLSLALLLL